jgi:hypothetical protein
MLGDMKPAAGEADVGTVTRGDHESGRVRLYAVPG